MKTNIATPSIQRKPSLWFRIGFGAPLAAAFLLCAVPAQAVNYAGNGSGDWDGSVGNGTLTLTDDGTNISGTLTTGGSLGNVLVIYIQTGAGGSFADTSGFLDNGDSSRKAISGYNGSGQQSVLTFASSFRPNYAIALGPQANNYGGLWQLADGGANSLPWITSVNLSPLGTGNGPFTFSFAGSQIGLTPGVNATIKLFGTLISNSGYRSSEAIAGNDTGSDGWAPFTQTAFATYTFDAGAPVTYPVTFSVDMSVPLASGAFNPANGDKVYAAGSFQATPWSGFQLSPTGGNTNIYTGTAQDADPLGTAEAYKFNFYSVANAGSTWEGVDNRPFTLASSQSLPLVYFDDVAPAPGTNLLTFKIDMTPQVELGYFGPATNVVEVQGTFQTPAKWVGGFTLTNNPNGANTNLYSGTYADGNYTGSWENYKFVYTNSVTGAATYENGNNRDFYTPSGPTNFPLAYFNNITSAYSIPVTFQVDMTVPILVGEFNPANGDTVGAAGSFQAPTWVVGASGFLLTNNPSGSNPNLYSGTYIDKNPPGTYEQYKFVINTNAGSGGGTAYEPPSGINRSFSLASGGQTLPPVFWGDNDANNVALTPTLVTFTVDMNNAVDKFGNPFVPANDDVLVNGDWIPWWNWTTELPDFSLPQYIMNNTPPSTLYSVTLTIPAGNSLELTYKYGIWHNTAAANTNMDNEAGFAQNHVRFIRDTGSYTLPTDIFGQQATNAAAATETSFGSLAIGTPAAGHIPVSWTGRPGVFLQTATGIGGGLWQTLYGTTNLLSPTTYGFCSTNYPMSGNKALFFRLINP